MTTLGGVFCDLYSLVRESWRASRGFEGFSYNVVTEGYKDSTAMGIPVLSDGLIVGW